MKTKQNLLIFLAIFSFSVTFAQRHDTHNRRNEAQLVIRMGENVRFDVVIDNRFYGNNMKRFTSEVMISGKHYVKVFMYVPSINRQTAEVVYSGDVFLKRNSVSFARITNDFRFVIKKIKPLNNGHVNNGGNGNGNRNDSHNNWDDNLNDDDYWGENTVIDPPGMNDADFQNLKSTVRNTSFETDKLLIAKEGVKKNKVTATQVRELMMLLKFENDKLELAKFAYEFCPKRNDYYTVTDALLYSASKNELLEYIAAFDSGR